MNWRIVTLRATLKSLKDEVVRREIQEVFEQVSDRMDSYDENA